MADPIAKGLSPLVNPRYEEAPPDYRGRFGEQDYHLLTKGWMKGKPETLCGGGSTLQATKDVRQVLPKWLARYEVRSLCDAGAGDLHWIREVPLDGITYRAYDLRPRAEGVEPLDITSELLPECDAILCRHVLNHLTPALVSEALDRFRRSARYLIATTFLTGLHVGGQLGNWMRWDLAQFGLGEPLEYAPDHEGLIALWRLQ